MHKEYIDIVYWTDRCHIVSKFEFFTCSNSPQKRNTILTEISSPGVTVTFLWQKSNFARAPTPQKKRKSSKSFDFFLQYFYTTRKIIFQRFPTVKPFEKLKNLGFSSLKKNMIFRRLFSKISDAATRDRKKNHFFNENRIIIRQRE